MSASSISCEFSLPAAADLPAARKQLGFAVRRALPLRERGAEAKRALCMGLLRRGLLPWGSCDRGYCQLWLEAGEAAEIMRQVRAGGRCAASTAQQHARPGPARCSPPCAWHALGVQQPGTATLSP